MTSYGSVVEVCLAECAYEGTLLSVHGEVESGLQTILFCLYVTQTNDG